MKKSRRRREVSRGDKRRPKIEFLENRLLLASDWRNPVYSMDINASGAVSPLDALLVINDLTRHGNVGSRPVDGLARPENSPYLDSNGDGKVSVLDALNVINELAGPSPFLLAEDFNRVTESSIVIGMGQESGTRVYRFQVDASFDDSDDLSGLEDTFAVYLKSENGGDETLIDRGAEGTSLFTLSGNVADFTPGLVRFDGEVVEIDLSSRPELEAARLVFQLINADDDNGSVVSLRPLSNIVDPARATPIRFNDRAESADMGSSLTTDHLTVTTTVEPIFENIRYSNISKRFQADLRLFNSGDPTGRQLIAAFPQLHPDSIQSGISGVLGDGTPYVSFFDAIRSGGLDNHGQSQAIPLTIDAAFSELVLETQILTGGPNQAPVFSSIPPITISPGQRETLQLMAEDPDGDATYFTTSTIDSGLSYSLSHSGEVVVHPAPSEVGTFEITFHAKDGILSSSQTLQVRVEDSPELATSISGTVVDVDGSPLAGVPIEVGRFQSTTDGAGQFSISLPSFTVPTESFDIHVPVGDPYFDPYSDGVRTIELHRAGYDITTGTDSSNPRQHPNLVSSYIDASVIYGADPIRAVALRTHDGSGKLRTSAGELLPLNDVATFGDNILENENNSRRDPQTLFAAGDVRANENPGLASLHTLLAREHNRRADELASADSNLDGEKLYQEARRWVGALIQHITYNEFLPLLLGHDALDSYSGYDPSTDASVSGLFSGAAFRFGHSTASSELILLGSGGQPLAESPLLARDAFFNPEPLKDLGLDPILRGMASQPIEALDTQVIDDLRNFLFGPPGTGGLDLVSLNIQRGRDLGLPSYAETRIQLGLSAVNTFADISSDAQVQNRLASVYSTVEQVDLWVGGLAEDHVAGAMLGETFHAIIKEQFERFRSGDRFWYENGQFTSEDLQAIRATTISSLVQRNTGIAELSPDAFTTQTQPDGPAGGGSTGLPGEVRSITGQGNNLSDPALGSGGENLRVDYEPAYGDGFASPAGADRPGAREISNAVFNQTDATVNSVGATQLFAIWGQLLTHDTNLTPGGTDDTLRVHGELRGGTETYPFVAEKLPLMLGHEVYVGYNNVIDRPIYLPKLNMSDSVQIDPQLDMNIGVDLASGGQAELEILANSLVDREGNPFIGTLSITEVPRELTPASLPETLIPETVVTIQPADMVFTTPAALTLPNRAGFPAGLIMDLWSINPVTGEFEIVGATQVSQDRQRIETIEGGIRTSSWHFPLPRPDDPERDPLCHECPYASVGSEVILSSGSYVEHQSLPSYQSLGQTRGLSLTYKSSRAAPTQALGFRADVIQEFAAPQPPEQLPNRYLARLSIGNGDQTFKVAGNQAGGLDAFWALGDLTTADELTGRIGFDSEELPTGVFSYELMAGVGTFATGQFSGALSTLRGSFTNVNLSDSPYGRGWTIDQLQSITVVPEDTGDIPAGSALLVEGNGQERLFRAPADGSDLPYQSPAFDYSELSRLSDGRFVRRMTNGTTYEFDHNHRLAVMSDRNGNQTVYEYDQDRLARVIDPAGLITRLDYVSGKLSSITNPNGAVTSFRIENGDLVEVTSADDSKRTLGYNASGLLTSDTNALGFTELLTYDDNKRLARATHSDGSVFKISAAATNGLVLSGSNQPATVATTRHALLSTPGGNVRRIEFDEDGFPSQEDDSFGRVYRVERNAKGVVTKQVDGRGFESSFRYDDNGLLTESIERWSHSQNIGGGGLFPINQYLIEENTLRKTRLQVADLNDDGLEDIVATGNVPYMLFGNGDGAFSDPIVLQSEITELDFVSDVHLADFDGDQVEDVLLTMIRNPSLAFLRGVGDGTFQAPQSIPVQGVPSSIDIGDVDGDGLNDVVLTNYLDYEMTVLSFNGAGLGIQSSMDVLSFPEVVRLEDVDSDGDLDAFVSAGDVVTLYTNDGAGQFADAGVLLSHADIADIAFADVDADGDRDLVYTGSSSGYLKRLSPGVFGTKTAIALPTDNQNVRSADVTGDGRADLIGWSDYGDALIFPGTAPEGFAEPLRSGLSPRSDIRVADLDGDGVADLVSGGVDAVITVLKGDNTGQFGQPDSDDYELSGNDHVIADLNGDGLQDSIQWSWNANSFVVAFGVSDREFVAPVDYSLDHAIKEMSVTDIDDDGDIDVFVSITGGFTLHVNDGSGRLGNPILYATDSPTNDLDKLHFDDVNGDGFVDVLAPDDYAYSDDSVSLFLADGNGAFALSGRLPIRNESDIELSDVNGDGLTDSISVGHRDFPTLFYHPRNGDGTFGDEITHPLSNDPNEFLYLLAWTTGDFNGDGRVDVATRLTEAESNNQTRFFVSINDGAGAFTTRSQLTGRTAYDDSLVSADINGDGNQDLISADGSSAGVTVWFGDGTGQFSEPDAYYAGENAYGVALSDADGDGDLDAYLSTAAGPVVLPNSGAIGTAVAAPASKQTYGNSFGIPSASTDELGRTVRRTIDPANGNVQSLIDALGAETQYTYTPQGLLATATDPLGRVTDYGYDGLGRLVSVTYASGTADEGTQRFEYDDAGNVTANIDENGNRTDFTFDSLNRLTATKDALGNVTQFSYDLAGNMVGVRDALGNSTSYHYDSENRLSSVFDALGNTTRFNYDLAGNVTETIDPNGNITRNRYDERNRVVSTIDAEGGVTRYTYDSDDNLISLTDPIGNRTRFAYDGRNRMIRETDPLDSTTEYIYDAVDHLAVLTDSEGNSTLFSYDFNDRLVIETDANAATTNYFYDRVGRLVQKTDRNARVTNYEYDNRDRLINETWNGGDNLLQYQYDAAGNLLSAKDSWSELTFTYDELNRPREIDNSGTPDVPSVTLGYTYDAAGNIIGFADSYNGSDQVLTAFEYDSLSRQTRILQSGQGVKEKRIDISYTASGRFEEFLRYSDRIATDPVARSSFQYDRLNRVKEIVHSSESSIIASYNYAYDESGKISRITGLRSDAQYLYDARGQLTDVYRGEGTPMADETYSYDSNGNRISSHLHSTYVTTTGNRLESDGEFEYEYDAEGNLVTRTEIATGIQRKHVWDFHNRLTQIFDTKDGQTTLYHTFRYDVFGRRIVVRDEIRVTQSAFVYDRANTLLEFLDGDSSRPIRYLNGPAVDLVFAIEEDSNVNWLVGDHLGSTRAVLAEDGTVEHEIDYDSFGNVIATSDIERLPSVLYAGRYFDKSTGLYFNRARYYDPVIGRFASEDPAGFSAAETNLFAYVENAPTGKTDPTGNESCLGCATGAQHLQPGIFSDDYPTTEDLEQSQDTDSQTKTQGQPTNYPRQSARRRTLDERIREVINQLEQEVNALRQKAGECSEIEKIKVANDINSRLRKINTLRQMLGKSKIPAATTGFSFGYMLEYFGEFEKFLQNRVVDPITNALEGARER